MDYSGIFIGLALVAATGALAFPASAQAPDGYQLQPYRTVGIQGDFSAGLVFEDLDADGVPEVGTANSEEVNRVFRRDTTRAGSSGADTRLRMRHLGHAGWEMTDGETTVLVDPYLTGYSSETGGRREDGTRVPDVEEIERRIDSADYVLVTHGHPDHVLDATAVARVLGADLIGHETAVNIARAYGVPEEQLITVLGGEDYAFDGFSVRVIPSLHSALSDKRYHNTPWPGEVPRGTEGPLESFDFKEGGSLAYLIRMSGERVLAMGSMNYIEREMEGLQPTVALVGALASRKEIYRYTDRLMEALGCPPVVFPTHVDLRREAHRNAAQDLGTEVRAACPSSRYVVPDRLGPLIVGAGTVERGTVDSSGAAAIFDTTRYHSESLDLRTRNLSTLLSVGQHS